MFNKILVVCVGNICRSPTAERLLKYPEVAAVQIGSEKPDAYSKAESIGVEAFFSKDKERTKNQ